MYPEHPSVIGDGGLPGTWFLEILPVTLELKLNVMAGVIQGVRKNLDNSSIFFILTCFKFISLKSVDGVCETYC